MIEKKNVKKAAATFLGLALAIGGVGCANFITTDSEKDLAQTVATVNISATLKTDSEYSGDVATGVEKVLKNVEANVSKRDLVAYFISTGYQYVESYGYSYEDTFNLLMDGLISREIMIQYAIAYYLKKNTALSADGCEAYRAAAIAAATEKEKKLLESNPEVLTLKYFLTEDGADMESYDRTVYNLNKSLNNSLDSLEETYIKEEDEEHDHEEARTLPTGVDTEKEDYYDPAYGVYTGRNTLDSCGSYEKLDGSTTSTRKKAYNAFLANLQGYNLVGNTGNEDTSDVTKIGYYYVELSSVLGQALINKYFEDLEEKAAEALTDEYVANSYTELYNSQKRSFEASPSDFASAMENVSDTSGIYYGKEGFGYVYNILLPFSKQQEMRYNTVKGNNDDEMYNLRKSLLTEVKGADKRGSWISAHEHANYSYEESDKFYFFKEQTKEENTQYEKLKQYAGTYAYNGTVDKTDEDEWKAKPNKVSIDEFITIFEKHINDTVGYAAAAKDTAWVSSYDDTSYEDKIEDGDYSQFTYYVGKTNLSGEAKDYFNPSSDIYKAISAVNELMFAYSTDTGCLNKYFGYAVSPYGTQFVKEFEYAAQYVVSQGVGSYAVCATDYGWHIVYASFVYGEGDVYGGYNAAEKDVEGTFSNMFYEYLKESAAANHSTQKQNEVLNSYNNSKSVTRYQERYQDLLDMQA